MSPVLAQFTLKLQTSCFPCQAPTPHIGRTCNLPEHTDFFFFFSRVQVVQPGDPLLRRPLAASHDAPLPRPPPRLAALTGAPQQPRQPQQRQCAPRALPRQRARGPRHILTRPAPLGVARLQGRDCLGAARSGTTRGAQEDRWRAGGRNTALRERRRARCEENGAAFNALTGPGKTFRAPGSSVDRT